MLRLVSRMEKQGVHRPKYCLENFKSVHLQDLGVEETVILKCIVKEHVDWTELIQWKQSLYTPWRRLGGEEV
jgi:hypothetical protein